MPYALVPMIDVRPSLRLPGRMQRQPLGLDQGGNAVLLDRRRALVWTPQDIRDPRAVTLCDDGADRLLNRRRRHLQTLTPDRVMAPTMRFGEMVGWALKEPPRGAWGRLYPHVGRAQNEVWLGPGGVEKNLLWRQDADVRGPHSKDIQDVFTRANGAASGSTSSDAQFTWSLPQGVSGKVNIVSNQLAFTRQAGDTFNVLLASLAMDTADHYAQVDIMSVTVAATGGAAVDVSVRLTNGTGTGDSGYGFSVSNATGGTGSRRVYDFVSDADIGTPDSTSTTSGTMYLQLSGSTYTAKIAGSTVFNGTNTTYPGTGSQRKCSINSYLSNDDTNTVTVDNFRAADLGGAQAFSLVVDTSSYALTGSDTTLLAQAIQTWLRVGR